MGDRQQTHVQKPFRMSEVLRKCNGACKSCDGATLSGTTKKGASREIRRALSGGNLDLKLDNEWEFFLGRS